MDDPSLKRPLDQVVALRYATADHAPVYRAVVEAFFRARERYQVELRPHEVLEALTEGPHHVEVGDEDWLSRHLDQLVAWGNLASRQDTGAVSRLDDFYRRSYVYALTAVGEAAHRAVAQVEATVGRSGSLQANMLVKIRESLDILASDDDPERVKTALHDLQSAFATLTEEASRFLGELDRQQSAEHADAERFDLYKRAVLAYVNRFVEQLRSLAGEIAHGMERVEARGVETVLHLAARSADLPPGLDGRDPVAEWVADQRARWEGLARWFVGGPGGEAQVHRLRQAAVQAVVELSRTLGRLNDRRVQPIDRAADFRILARWFSACADEEAAHRLWQGAFGLYPARHFHLADPDAEPVSPHTSWWDAPPAAVPVRLRTHGKVSRTGRTPAAADHSSTRIWIEQKRRRERAQLDAALRRFAGRGPLRLSDLATLDALEFDLLLSLLDEALSSPEEEGVRRTRTADGRLDLTLTPPDAADAEAELVTPRGRLRCRDYVLTVEDVRTGGAWRAEGPTREGTGA